MITRRKFFSGTAALFGASALAQRIRRRDKAARRARDTEHLSRRESQLPAGRYT